MRSKLNSNFNLEMDKWNIIVGTSSLIILNRESLTSVICRTITILNIVNFFFLSEIIFDSVDLIAIHIRKEQKCLFVPKQKLKRFFLIDYNSRKWLDSFFFFFFWNSNFDFKSKQQDIQSKIQSWICDSNQIRSDFKKTFGWNLSMEWWRDWNKTLINIQNFSKDYRSKMLIFQCFTFYTLWSPMIIICLDGISPHPLTSKFFKQNFFQLEIVSLQISLLKFIKLFNEQNWKKRTKKEKKQKFIDSIRFSLRAFGSRD